jgi:hypothetical protein
MDMTKQSRCSAIDSNTRNAISPRAFFSSRSDFSALLPVMTRKQARGLLHLAKTRMLLA